MKKICISLCLLLIIILTISCSGVIGEKNGTSEYLRIHIRANSSSFADQNIKYIIKDSVVSYLAKTVVSASSKNDVMNKINADKRSIERLIDGILESNGFDYKAEVQIKNEKFPTRVYEDITLYSGYYDAVIINLGSGEGDNWWCVVYPPFCFTDVKNVTYRSKIVEIINKFKSSRP